MVRTRIFRDSNGNEGDGGLTEKMLKLTIGNHNHSSTSLVQLYPISSEDKPDGVVVKVQPPKQPANKNLHHVPCDLVLCIDVSGSMHSSAPLPASPDGEQDSQEDTGLSVLDLVKHAARTILETMDSKDRLGIVTFSARAEVLQPLTPMTAQNKAKTVKKIEDMRPTDVTNLWHGILDGLKLFKEGEDGQPSSSGRVPALLVLTDGMPNHMCPSQGYIPKLRTMEPLPATIHTFGFGYSLRSGLLKSIAEVGGGNYSFIPDAGMIGTVFVHAVANLQSTFANNAKLRLTFPSYLKLHETTGEAVESQQPVELEGDIPEPLTSLTIPLGNLQYGQSRDIYLAYGNTGETIQAAAKTNPPPVLTAVLEYQHFTDITHQAVAQCNTLPFPSPSAPCLDPAEIAYHISRSSLIAFLSTLFPLNSVHEHKPLKHLPDDLPDLIRNLTATLPAFTNPEFATTHPGCRSLLMDLAGTSTPTTLTTTAPADWTGQIALALFHPSYYRRWGMHYLPSLAGAHARQVCNSFKDAGPLEYGKDSPLFVACRDRLDAAFDTLPAPAPSRALHGGDHNPAGGGGYKAGNGAHGGGGGAARTVKPPVSMRSYNNVASGCFAGCMRVLLAGQSGGLEPRSVRVGRLRAGMEVVTPRGSRRVVAVLRMPVRRAEMCLVGPRGGKAALLVTPWHPVLSPSGGEWEFPKDLPLRPVRYTGAVYSVLLERDEDVDAHAIMVGSMWGVTMGHGLLTAVDGRRDVRAHRFYGDYGKVSRALARLPRKAGGVALGGGLTRDLETGMVNGFSRVDERQVKGLSTVQRKGVASV